MEKLDDPRIRTLVPLVREKNQTNFLRVVAEITVKVPDSDVMGKYILPGVISLYQNHNFACSRGATCSTIPLWPRQPR